MQEKKNSTSENQLMIKLNIKTKFLSAIQNDGKNLTRVFFGRF